METINLFSKNDFMDMGLAMAHAYQLKENFGNKTSKAEKLQSLLATARKRKEQRVGGSMKQKKKRTELSVNLNLFEYDPNLNRYSQLKAIKGGGCRQITVQRTSHVRDILSNAESVFFPNGKSTKGFKLSSYTAALADFTQTVLTSADEDLSLEDYKEKYGLKDLRFTLLIKKLSAFSILQSQMQLNQDSDSDFEDTNPLPSIKLSSLSPSFQSSSPLQRRRNLISQQNDEFQKILEADRNKLQVTRKLIYIIFFISPFKYVFVTFKGRNLCNFCSFSPNP